jgi:hypothetical protein
VYWHSHAVASDLRRSRRQKEQNRSVQTCRNVKIETLYLDLHANDGHCTRSYSTTTDSTITADSRRQPTPIDHSTRGVRRRNDLVRCPRRGHSFDQHASDLATCRRGRLTREGPPLDKGGRGGEWSTTQAGLRLLRRNDMGFDRRTMDNGTLRLPSCSREGTPERSLAIDD